MKNKKQTARKRNKRFLSVGPVTTRETTGPTLHRVNIRSALTLRVKQLSKEIATKQNLLKRLTAALRVLGSQRERRTDG